MSRILLVEDDKSIVNNLTSICMVKALKLIR